MSVRGYQSAEVLRHRAAVREWLENAVRAGRMADRLEQLADALEREAAPPECRFRPRPVQMTLAAPDHRAAAEALARRIDAANREAAAAHRGLFRIVRSSPRAAKK